MTDLWPKDLELDVPPRTPALIMKEQAALLGAKTRNLVVGDVRRLDFNAHNFAFGYAFEIQAPALKYAYKLFMIYHDVELYPVSFDLDSEVAKELNANSKDFLEVNSEEEMVQTLRKIFASRRTRMVITAILAQVEAISKPMSAAAG